MITIKIRDNGPLVVYGEFTLTDGTNTPLPVSTEKPGVAFCRCGASQKKPFCDGSHHPCGFESVIRAEPAN